MVSPQPALRPSQPHLHLKGFQCPVCEQPIPNEKAEQVRSRMEARERELADAVGARLKEQFAAERVKIEADARATVEQAKKESAVALEAVRNEAAVKELAARQEGEKVGQAAAYITGERFRQHMTSIEAQTDKLLDVDVAEEKAHRKVWETRGGLLKSLQKAHGNLRADVARILGTRDAE
jgi:hypothetical protein